MKTTVECPNSFEGRIKKLREERGWSLAKVGEKSGIKGETVGKHERGDTSPNIWHIEGYSKAFDVSVEYLVTGKHSFDNREMRNIELYRAICGLSNNAYVALKDMLKVLSKL